MKYLTDLNFMNFYKLFKLLFLKIQGYFCPYDQNPN